MPDLGGRRVAFLEGRRQAELADLIQRHNGTPLPAPCLREVHSPDSTELQASIARALESPLDIAIFLTGVGTQTVFDAARAMGRESHLREQLKGAVVVVRGPKPTAVLRKLGVRIDLAAAPPNTSAEVLQVLEGQELRDKRVVLQLYGAPDPDLSQTIRKRGAEVVELAPYRWDRPVDASPILYLLDALDAGAVDALLVTSQAQVHNLFDVAREVGRVPELNGVAIGAQGPVAESALAQHGLSVSFKPNHGHMGALVVAAAEYFLEHAA
jgi:uroporphyrinogen-III synthase